MINSSQDLREEVNSEDNRVHYCHQVNDENNSQSKSIYPLRSGNLAQRRKP
jgi:hypothetical protein